MKMYLNIIRERLELRKYPTAECVCSFNTRQIPGGNANLKINRNIAVFEWLENLGIVKFDVNEYILTRYGLDMYLYREHGGVFCISE